MKKYNQLLLLIISIVSLTLFLIYRHEYNRLHYVLEVFNFFGQPCNNTDLEDTDRILSHHDWGPTPVWQELESGYVYSAFLTPDNEVKSLAVLSDKNLIPRNCYLWYEDRKKPLIGRFKFSKATSDERVNLYFLYCSIAATDKLKDPAYAVSFSYKAKKENELKKSMINANQQKPTKVKMNATICVSPSVYSKKRLIEFISYHKLIGIESFIFYNKDIPHRLVKLITNLTVRLGIHVAFLPWNFPKPETSITRTIVENDCTLRTLGRTLYTTTLELNEYIVPSLVYSFSALFNNVDTQAQKFSLPVQKFCIGSSDSTQPISLANLQVSDDFDFNIVRYIYKNYQNWNELSTAVLTRDFASIHKYVKCAKQPDKSHQDRSMMKFSTDLIRSTLFQLFLHNQI